MIIIEREAVLSVLLRDCPADEDEYVLVSSDLKEQLLLPEQPQQSSYDAEDTEDCCSLASTDCSSVSSLSSASLRKTVSFSTAHNQVHTVDRLYPKDELTKHFYSGEDTARFRSEYRLERKVLADLGDIRENHEEELSGLFGKSSEGFNISRVVVLHDDVLETFSSSTSSGEDFDNDSFWSGSITWY